MRISIEGNIATGKSTVLDGLQALGYTVRPEPVKEWETLLDLYYKDPATWSLCFNLKVLHSFQNAPSKDPHDPSKPVFIERSPGACRHVFGQLSYNDQHISPAAWEVFKEFATLLWWEPDAYIFISTPTAVCHERLQKRGRPCEQDIPQEFLGRIEFQYQNFLKFTEKPVHMIDGTMDLQAQIQDIINCVQTPV
jgi:deoxyadenosine/deoxycytidine kinase